MSNNRRDVCNERRTPQLIICSSEASTSVDNLETSTLSLPFVCPTVHVFPPDVTIVS